jgi:DNA end-binding protein Ku
MRYAHELRDPSELDVPAGKQGVSDREIDMAERLVEGMVSAWDPEKYKDSYRDDLMKMIEKRVEAGQLEKSPEPAAKAEKAPRSNVIDLMALLKQSVEEGGKPGRKAPAKAASSKSAAKKRPAKPTKKTAAHKPAAAKKRKSA